MIVVEALRLCELGFEESPLSNVAHAIVSLTTIFMYLLPPSTSIPRTPLSLQLFFSLKRRLRSRLPQISPCTSPPTSTSVPPTPLPSQTSPAPSPPRQTSPCTSHDAHRIFARARIHVVKGVVDELRQKGGDVLIGKGVMD